MLAAEVDGRLIVENSYGVMDLGPCEGCRLSHIARAATQVSEIVGKRDQLLEVFAANRF